MPSNDLLGIEKLKKDLEELKMSSITVGYQGDSGRRRHPNGSGASIAEVASYMEFGTNTIPARPFLRTAVKQHEKAIKTSAKRAIAKMIDKRDNADDAVETIGNAVVAAVHKTIDTAASWAAPLASSTVKAKGSSSPLVDSKEMRSSVSWARRGNAGEIIKQGGEV